MKGLQVQECKLCGATISALFPMEEHQASESCSSMVRYKQLRAEGWSMIKKTYLGCVNELGLPVKTIKVPGHLFSTSSAESYVGFRWWDKKSRSKLFAVSICPSWVVEVFEVMSEQMAHSFSAIAETGAFDLGPRGRAFVEYLDNNPEERGIFLTAMRLGGVKRACEMLEKNHE